ncbi:MAG TPA: tRNA (uridine(34)/cytosine(34)/5-carboxymethylaminomethyluridine(34)-2'-O)-methyltransferase TrmL [Elusimicrobia bacterium]|nr:tRNA (uridine(34)/cytosine(34)/5-carboxymethylaminomethyluridine(34)-2'-O)-methyltransferase TrmL [Elusimicrobiota bacterium]HBT61670.1 tRNA (uridine(34)/cytosine(34)/5-carboxymethylaminomethyluridine(34)-2'-O)-methyltransferase TrmL [Elusimicrobiota bacterium]
MNVALFEPEIPWNTGNIGRTCIAAQATLHLIGPLGFSLGGPEIRRSGLDYWPKLKLARHEDMSGFISSLPANPSVLVFTTKAARSFRDAPFRPDSFLLFGRESSGLPESVLERFSGSLFRIPVSGEVRSLNLSTAVAVALYEGLRRTGGDPGRATMCYDNG